MGLGDRLEAAQRQCEAMNKSAADMQAARLSFRELEDEIRWAKQRLGDLRHYWIWVFIVRDGCRLRRLYDGADQPRARQDASGIVSTIAALKGRSTQKIQQTSNDNCVVNAPESLKRKATPVTSRCEISGTAHPLAV